MQGLIIMLGILTLVAHVSGGVWTVMFSPKVLTAIAASIGIDVVADSWLKSSPDKMFEEIQAKLHAQMNDQLALALASLRKDDKLPGTFDSQYVVFGLVLIGLLLLGNLVYLRNQHKKLRRRQQEQPIAL